MIAPITGAVGMLFMRYLLRSRGSRSFAASMPRFTPSATAPEERCGFYASRRARALIVKRISALTVMRIRAMMPVIYDVYCSPGRRLQGSAGRQSAGRVTTKRRRAISAGFAASIRFSAPGSLPYA